MAKRYKNITFINVALLCCCVLLVYCCISWRREVQLVKLNLNVCKSQLILKNDNDFVKVKEFDSCSQANDKLRGEVHALSLKLAEKSRDLRALQQKLELHPISNNQQECKPCKNDNNNQLSNQQIDFIKNPLIEEWKEGWLCPKSISDTSVWQDAVSSLPWFPNGGRVRGELYPNASYEHFNTRDGPLSSQWYCDKIMTNLEPYIEPSGELSSDDIAVGVFSGERLTFSRAAACKMTWMTRFKNSHIYAASAEPTIPVIGLGPRYGIKPDYENLNDIQKLQILASRDLYLRHPTAKWFYVVGDDTYVVADNIVRMLEQYNANELHWLVVFPGEMGLKYEIDLNEWPDHHDILDEEAPRFYWHSGAVGWFISRPLARKFAAHAERFLALDYVKQDYECNCPDVLSGLLLTLLGAQPMTVGAEWWYGINDGSEAADPLVLLGAREPVILHYISPRRMLALEQWYIHRQLDRSHNAMALAWRDGDIESTSQALNTLLFKTRLQIDSRFDAVRRWQSALIRSSIHSGYPTRAYDIPTEDGVWYDRDDDWLPAPDIPDDTYEAMQFKKELGRNQSMSDSTDLNELEESIEMQQSLIANDNDNNSNNDDDLVNDDKQKQNDSEPLFKQGSFTTLMGGRCARTRHNRPDLKQELPLKYQQQQPVDEERKRQLNPIEHENRDAFDLRKELHELMQSRQDSDNEICSCTYELAKTGNAAFFGLCEYSPTFFETAYIGSPDLVGLGVTNQEQEINPRHTGHNYEQLIPLMLERYRHTTARVLQLGATHGASTAMWRHYFGVLATLIVVDNQHPIDYHVFEKENLKLTTAQLQKLQSEHEEQLGYQYAGPHYAHGIERALKLSKNGFEIVIDDNSHEYGDQRRVFIQLFPKLARGGVYIVAGLNVAYENFDKDKPSWISDTKKMLDTLNRRNFDPKYAVLSNHIDHLIQSIHCSEEICAYIRA